MLHSEVRILQSNNLLFNPKMEIFWISTAFVQFNTILIKKVQNYFEFMINYIITVTSHVRNNNVFGFLSTSIFTDDITCVMILYWIDAVFTATLELKHSAPSWMCLICTGLVKLLP